MLDLISCFVFPEKFNVNEAQLRPKLYFAQACTNSAFCISTSLPPEMGTKCGKFKSNVRLKLISHDLYFMQFIIQTSNSGQERVKYSYAYMVLYGNNVLA